VPAVRKNAAGLAVPRQMPAREPAARTGVVVEPAVPSAAGMRRALPGRGARTPGTAPFTGSRQAAAADTSLLIPGLPLPGSLQEQIDAAARDEGARRGAVADAERAHAEATAAHAWDRLPELDAMLLEARQAHALAYGHLTGLLTVARDISETMTAEQAAVADERRRADALAAEGRALAAERDTMGALEAREGEFWGFLRAAQEAFKDMRDLEQQVQRHRQARNDARAAVHGEPVPVRAQRPNRTDVLREGRPGVRELLELRP